MNTGEFLLLRNEFDDFIRSKLRPGAVAVKEVSNVSVDSLSDARMSEEGTSSGADA